DGTRAGCAVPRGDRRGRAQPRDHAHRARVDGSSRAEPRRVAEHAWTSRALAPGPSEGARRDHATGRSGGAPGHARSSGCGRGPGPRRDVRVALMGGLEVVDTRGPATYSRPDMTELTPRVLSLLSIGLVLPGLPGASAE